MSSLSKKERYSFAVLLINLLIQLVLLSFSTGIELEKKALFGYNENPKYSWNIDAYDYTELLLYGFFPLALFAIYYFVIRKK